MPYSAISSRRMPYDVDGTEVGYNSAGYGSYTDYGNGVTAWLDSINKTELNDEDRIAVPSGINFSTVILWFFFPEAREIEAAICASHGGRDPFYAVEIQGSNDTTNGMDGTWETATFPSGAPVVNEGAYADFWRDAIKPVSFSGAKKVIRIKLSGGHEARLTAVHLYGRKAAGETPDDIQFCNTSTGAEKTALMDWGDRPEGTTLIDSFKVKNASPDKIANDINLQLNHADFLMSWSPDGPWTATLDIATLGVGALSNTVYVRNKLEPPLLLLGPYAARVIASVGSWT